MLLYFAVLPLLVGSFTIDLPYQTNFMVKIKGIDLRKINDRTIDDLKYLFKTEIMIC